MAQPKILLFDIETAPNVSFTWGKYDQNVIDFVEQWYLLCFAYKWHGQKSVTVKALPDYPGYKKDKTNDRSLVQDLWALFNEADIIIAHNGDRFDIKKSNALFLRHNLGIPSHYRTGETVKVARKQFSLNSNKLNDIAKELGMGQKVPHTGFDLWRSCMEGDSAAWRLMKRYNKQDVVLLEKVYTKLLPWIENHPNYNVFLEKECCTNCGSSNVTSNGYRFAQGTRYRRLQCNDCGAWGKQTLTGKGKISGR